MITTTTTTDGIQIDVITVWNASSVRVMCITHEWYTRGGNEAYAKMLAFVHDNEPTTENIYWVAKDIFDHSSEYMLDGADIGSIMYSIGAEVVERFYAPEVEGGE